MIAELDPSPGVDTCVSLTLDNWMAQWKALSAYPPACTYVDYVFSVFVACKLGAY